MFHLIWHYPIEFNYSFVFDWNYFDYFVVCTLVKRRLIYEKFLVIVIFNIKEPLLYLLWKSVNILLSIDY